MVVSQPPKQDLKRLRMVMQNGLPACIFGTLSAFAMALVWQLEWSGLPGYQIAANADAEHVVVSFWSLSLGRTTGRRSRPTGSSVRPRVVPRLVHRNTTTKQEVSLTWFYRVRLDL